MNTEALRRTLEEFQFADVNKSIKKSLSKSEKTSDSLSIDVRLGLCDQALDKTWTLYDDDDTLFSSFSDQPRAVEQQPTTSNDQHAKKRTAWLKFFIKEAFASGVNKFVGGISPSLLLLFQFWAGGYAFPQFYLSDVCIGFTEQHAALQGFGDSLAERRTVLRAVLNNAGGATPRPIDPSSADSSAASSRVEVRRDLSSSPRQYRVDMAGFEYPVVAPAGSIPPEQIEVDMQLAKHLVEEYRKPLESGSDKSPPFKIGFGTQSTSPTMSTVHVNPEVNDHAVFPVYFLRDNSVKAIVTFVSISDGALVRGDTKPVFEHIGLQQIAAVVIDQSKVLLSGRYLLQYKKAELNGAASTATTDDVPLNRDIVVVGLFEGRTPERYVFVLTVNLACKTVQMTKLSELIERKIISKVFIDFATPVPDEVMRVWTERAREHLLPVTFSEESRNSVQADVEFKESFLLPGGAPKKSRSASQAAIALAKAKWTIRLGPRQQLLLPTTIPAGKKGVSGANPALSAPPQRASAAAANKGIAGAFVTGVAAGGGDSRQGLRGGTEVKKPAPRPTAAKASASAASKANTLSASKRDAAASAAPAAGKNSGSGGNKRLSSSSYQDFSPSQFDRYASSVPTPSSFVFPGFFAGMAADFQSTIKESLTNFDEQMRQLKASSAMIQQKEIQDAEHRAKKAKLDADADKLEEATELRKTRAFELAESQAKTKHEAELADQNVKREEVRLDSQRKRIKLDSETANLAVREQEEYSYDRDRAREVQRQNDSLNILVRQQAASLQFQNSANRSSFTMQIERATFDHNRRDNELLMTQNIVGASRNSSMLTGVTEQIFLASAHGSSTSSSSSSSSSSTSASSSSSTSSFAASSSSSAEEYENLETETEEEQETSHSTTASHFL